MTSKIRCIYKNSISVIAAFFFLTYQNYSLAQAGDRLSPEIRAYLFHIVRKSPILENNIGYAFEFMGPKILLADKSINYDSTESLLINAPELLVIRREEIAKAPKGLIAEAANKTAIWILNKTLQSIQLKINNTDNTVFKDYIGYFNENLPKQVIRSKYYNNLFNPSMSPIFNSNLSLYDRNTLLTSLGANSIQERKAIFEAQHRAINKTIEKNAREIFQYLGGESKEFENYLLAAGDGSYTTGLLQERERDDEGNWNKGLPKAIGLFPYDIKIIENELVPERICNRVMTMVGNGKQTNLHFDVWGYNTNRQTTVVIEKNGYTYHLFGSEKTRFLSPDSSFSKGVTFQKIINDLNGNTFNELEKVLKGKNGYDEQIKDIDRQIYETLFLINEKEASYGELTKASYKTKKNPSRQARKIKEENKDFGPVNITPTTKSKKKARGRKQADLVELYQIYETLEADKTNLIEERKPYSDEYELKKNVLENYRRQMGLKWMKFKEIDGLYVFEDSSTFDVRTQEFLFAPSNDTSSFEVRLISIPDDLIGETSDEVMLHISKIDVEPFYDADFKISLNDVFSSDDFNFNGKIFQAEDSIKLIRFFKQFEKVSPQILFDVHGNGVGIWENNKVIKALESEELNSYPGSTSEERAISRSSNEFKRLRKTELFLKADRNLAIKINSYTDPVVSNLEIKNSKLQALLDNKKVTKNDLLSAYRSIAVLSQLKLEFNILCSKYLPPARAKAIIDAFNNSLEKSNIVVGNEILKVKDFRL
jgi:hypothetical protein